MSKSILFHNILNTHITLNTFQNIYFYKTYLLIIVLVIMLCRKYSFIIIISFALYYMRDIRIITKYNHSIVKIIIKI